MRVKIAGLLLGLLIAIGALSGVSTLFGAVSLRQATAALDDLRRTDLLPLVHLKALSDAYAVSVVDASHKMRNAGFTWEEGTKALADAEGAIRTAWAAINAVPLSPAARPLMADAESRKAAADRVFAELLQAATARDRAALDPLVTQRMYPAIDPLTEVIGAVLDAQIASAEVLVEQTGDAAWLAAVTQSGLAGLTLCLLGAAGACVMIRVTRPLARLTTATHRLAGGDLAAAIPYGERDDEVGALARAVVIFQASLVEGAQARARQSEAQQLAEQQRHAALRGMAERVEAETRSAVEQVASRMERMADDAHAMETSANSVAADSASVSGAADKAQRNIQTVAAATEQLGASIREITQQVATASGATRRAADFGRDGRDRIAALATEIAGIGNVAGLIAGIAGQTNLLALNATIEAARAGDAGKGFAVVAGEVKALAAETAKATEQIARQVQQMSVASTGAVGAVQRMAEAVAEVDQVSAAIAAAMEQQSAATQEIGRAVTESTTATVDVTARIAGVAQETTAAGARATGVRELAGAALESVSILRSTLVRVVRESAPEADRRSKARIAAMLPARLELAGEAGALAVTLADISAGGCALLPGAPPLAPAQRGLLRIDALAPGLALPVEVISGDRTEPRLRLRFRDLDAVTQASLEAALQRLQRKAA